MPDMPGNTREDIVERLRNGSLSAHKAEQVLHAGGKDWRTACLEAEESRRAFLQDARGVDLSVLSIYSKATTESFNIARRREANLTRIENAIGTVQIPVGYAGPLAVRGAHAQGDFLVPLATNEAALVAGVNRGCKLAQEAGAVEVRILKDGMTRAPLFVAASVKDAEKAEAWLASEEALSTLAPLVKKTTSHGGLEEVRPIRGLEEPTALYVRFRFFTGDAMGMNMATIASETLCGEITARFPGLRLLALSGNLCSDKKSTGINVREGRGLSVESRLVIPAEQLATYDVDAATLEMVNYYKNLYGGKLAGTYGGFNAHAANQVAAIFAATGQDLAQIVESASCSTLVRAGVDGSAEVRCVLPCIEVGTVGGGTDTPTAKACLNLLGCAGGGSPAGENRRKLGEIVAATVLVGELNLLVALARNELAKSHARLTR